MKQEEKNLIENLFNQLKKNEEKFPGRNTEAEKYIKNLILKQPNSIYYIVQTVLVQESVIKKLNTELELQKKNYKEKEEPNFLSSSSLDQKNNTISSINNTTSETKKNYNHSQLNPKNNINDLYNNHPNNTNNDSFLGSAIKTAAGVAGGVVLGNMFSNLFQHNNNEKHVDHIIEHDTIIEKNINNTNFQNNNKDDLNNTEEELSSHNMFHTDSNNTEEELSSHNMFHTDSNNTEEELSSNDMFSDNDDIDDLNDL
ncbi:DUF2076 domain-containing protein [Buchnera aphidicola]|uniref:DUF2076 family protein n=1 Tax=Buchnera aphidicola (Anoecia oenotherae) TaxID=1241833 RepID=A0A4D6XZ45_9GAMM|nr:DUF2076 family protein [Buchnera aphidicola]QCI19280.1 DUF2076 family protein [Buchnera aphidicola (Anoecia oenotherae)]